MATERSNRPQLADIRTMPVGEIARLPAEHLALLQDEAEEALNAAKRTKDWLEGAIALRYGEEAARLRAAQGKDTGTVRFDDGPVTVVADLPKRVEWDQDLLATLVERMRASGEKVADYVSIEIKVSERAFTAWPEAIRQAFSPARTVRTGKPTFRLMLEESR
ncbi:hypothetical protein EDC22_10518 [Tepidamorphus gemmatus]|uniref:Uncharacterized protein n=1 Tax=Tepidamorphus gemmatus TaxID=747076 RepID=A0A4R3MA97_9HYPH|nr:hypothetical protein [Tepidamorphus gemmatus]TCT10521.1 hypothetical protein EDC22_10518 [Tepidamorphus gemmatus]